MKPFALLRPFLYACLILAACSIHLQAEEYQWSLSVDKAFLPKTPDLHPRAFLWIPPGCQRVRAVVIAQNNMEEPTILGHPAFRKAMAELGFAEIFVTPTLGSIHFRFDKGEGELLEQLLKDFAAVSGYQELQVAPLVPMGHSAMASFPFDIALWKPERTLASLSISGMWPFFKDQTPENINGSPDWGDRNIDGVPFLVTKGEYEIGVKDLWSGWYGGVRGDFAVKHPQTILTQIVEPGCGHFEVSDEKVDFLAYYLRKVAQYRLPVNAPLNAPVALKPIKPQDGWLYDGWRLDQQPTAPANAYGFYQGKKEQAFFAFDGEMARVIETFQARFRGQQPAVLSFKTKKGVTPHNCDHVDCHLPFVPEDDGITMKVSGVFLDQYPWKSGKFQERPIQQNDPVASPAGEEHKIMVKRICGFGKQTEPNTIAVNLDRSLLRLAPNDFLTIALWADYPGNGQFKRMVQQGEIRFSPNTKGQAQEIHFPAIPNQQARSGMPPVKLQARSSAGLPVRYFVREGPAEVDDTGKLSFTAIPPRSAFPIKVTVVAWQWGQSAPTPVQTAPLAEQTFSITAPGRW